MKKGHGSEKSKKKHMEGLEGKKRKGRMIQLKS